MNVRTEVPGVHLGAFGGLGGGMGIEIVATTGTFELSAIDFKSSYNNFIPDFNGRIAYDNKNKYLRIYSGATGANTELYQGRTGFIGINNSSPAYHLDVNGNINYTGNIFKNGVLQATIGATGPTGPTGPAGTNGAAGAQGATGPTGPTGPAGTNGAAGAQGATGPTGPTGPAGTNGAAGAQGATGPTGPTGPAGTNGAAGAQGATGPTGPTGPAGTNGAAGAQGATGPTGPTGPAGTNGAAGAQGATGPTGPTGPAGTNGAAGAQGATGPTGPTGPAGSYTIGTGNAGSTGTLMLFDEATGNIFYVPSNTPTNSFYVTRNENPPGYDFARTLSVGANIIPGTTECVIGTSLIPWRKVTLNSAGPSGNLTDTGIYFSSNKSITYEQNARLLLTPNVSIGTVGPTGTGVPFQVNKSSSSSIGFTGFALLGTTGTIQTGASVGTRSVSAYFSAHVWSAAGFVASSDSRIKKEITDLSDGVALDALRQIEPVQYKYIDALQRGSDTVTGFIAQQVKEVFPNAVSTQTEVVPNIYSMKSVSINETTLEIYDIPESIVNSLNAGKLVRFYDSMGKQYDWNIQSLMNSTTIVLTRPNMSEITFDPSYPNQLFIYGTEVDDFHTLNKEYLFTVNFAATQELDRQVQALRAENTALKEQIAAIKAFVNMP
jgi:hypothetical protein